MACRDCMREAAERNREVIRNGIRLGLSAKSKPSLAQVRRDMVAGLRRIYGGFAGVDPIRSEVFYEEWMRVFEDELLGFLPFPEVDLCRPA